MAEFVKVHGFRPRGRDQQHDYFPASDRRGENPILDGKIVQVHEVGGPKTVHANITFEVRRYGNGHVELWLTDAEARGRTAWWMNKPLSNTELDRLRFDLSNLD